MSDVSELDDITVEKMLVASEEVEQDEDRSVIIHTMPPPMQLEYL